MPEKCRFFWMPFLSRVEILKISWRPFQGIRPHIKDSGKTKILICLTVFESATVSTYWLGECFLDAFRLGHFIFNAVLFFFSFRLTRPNIMHKTHNIVSRLIVLRKQYRTAQYTDINIDYSDDQIIIIIIMYYYYFSNGILRVSVCMHIGMAKREEKPQLYKCVRVVPVCVWLRYLHIVI